jgi:hypothetical protein
MHNLAQSAAAHALHDAPEDADSGKDGTGHSGLATAELVLKMTDPMAIK